MRMLSTGTPLSHPSSASGDDGEQPGTRLPMDAFALAVARKMLQMLATGTPLSHPSSASGDYREQPAETLAQFVQMLQSLMPSTSPLSRPSQPYEKNLAQPREHRGRLKSRSRSRGRGSNGEWYAPAYGYNEKPHDPVEDVQARWHPTVEERKVLFMRDRILQEEIIMLTERVQMLECERMTQWLTEHAEQT